MKIVLYTYSSPKGFGQFAIDVPGWDGIPGFSIEFTKDGLQNVIKSEGQSLNHVLDKFAENGIEADIVSAFEDSLVTIFSEDQDYS